MTEQVKRFKNDLQRISKDTVIISFCEGGAWTAYFKTELGALRVFYAYRNTKSLTYSRHTNNPLGHDFCIDVYK